MMARNLNPNLPVHDGSLFTWHTGVGAIEVSDLERNEPLHRIYGCVWTDACDMGFKVRSHRTGVEKVFVYQSLVEHEGETVLWIYRSEDGQVIQVHND